MNTKYIIKIVCPECNADKKYFHYDTYKEELSCKHCGLVINAPQIAGIIFPGVKHIKIKISEGSRNPI